MTSTVVYVANGFNRENARLQPWRYVYELAAYRAVDCEVFVITEGGSEKKIEKWSDSLTVIETNLLSVKKQKHLKVLLSDLSPDEIWWSTTSRTLAFYPLLSSLPCKIVSFITCPLYTWKELIRASLTGVPWEQTKALWQQRFVPRFIFSWLLNRNFIHQVVLQSEKNYTEFMQMGVSPDKLHLIPVGIDKEDIGEVAPALIDTIRQRHPEIIDKVVYLYFGALRPIRGFDCLLQAFEGTIKKSDNVHLMVLARGADEAKCADVHDYLNKHHLTSTVSIVGGWLTREEVWSYIELSDAAVLPFVLVPSDIPIAVLEAMARGKPVVVSNVDGLPEMAKGRGVIIDPLNKQEFSEQLYLLSVDHKRRKALGLAAKDYMDEYPCWDDVGKLAKEI